MLTDAEILDNITNLRIAMAEAMSGVDVQDYESIMTTCGIFIAGLDAMLVMRHNRD